MAGVMRGPRAGTWLVAVAVLLVVAGSAWSKAWKGAVPGQTTRQEVIDKFGPPFKEFSKGGKLSNGLSYQGDQAIEGALEADFYFDKNDVLFRIDVFPVRQITGDQVKRIFGKRYVERVSSKGYKYFVYPETGMVVFFEKDGKLVRSFTFIEGKKKPVKSGWLREWLPGNGCCRSPGARLGVSAGHEGGPGCSSTV